MSDTATPEAKLAAQATAYVVLRLETSTSDEPISWSLARGGTEFASSAQDAVRVVANGKEGTYVAVPKRSWKPIAVKVEQTVKVRLEDA